MFISYLLICSLPSVIADEREKCPVIPRIEVRALLELCASDVDVQKTFSSADSSNDAFVLHQIGQDETQKKSKGITKCRKKITITIRMNTQGKTITTEEYLTVDHIYDHLGKKRYKLLYPLVIELTQFQVLQGYALHFEQLVNAEAREEIINKDMEGFTGCVTTGNPTCGYTYLNNAPVPYSEGFCCSCDDITNLARQPTYQGVLGSDQIVYSYRIENPFHEIKKEKEKQNHPVVEGDEEGRINDYPIRRKRFSFSKMFKKVIPEPDTKSAKSGHVFMMPMEYFMYPPMERGIHMLGVFRDYNSHHIDLNDPWEPIFTMGGTRLPDTETMHPKRVLNILVIKKEGEDIFLTGDLKPDDFEVLKPSDVFKRSLPDHSRIHVMRLKNRRPNYEQLYKGVVNLMNLLNIAPELNETHLGPKLTQNNHWGSALTQSVIQQIWPFMAPSFKTDVQYYAPDVVQALRQEPTETKQVEKRSAADYAQLTCCVTECIQRSKACIDAVFWATIEWYKNLWNLLTSRIQYYTSKLLNVICKNKMESEHLAHTKSHNITHTKHNKPIKSKPLLKIAPVKSQHVKIQQPQTDFESVFHKNKSKMEVNFFVLKKSSKSKPPECKLNTEEPQQCHTSEDPKKITELLDNLWKHHVLSKRDPIKNSSRKNMTLLLTEKLYTMLGGKPQESPKSKANQKPVRKSQKVKPVKKPTKSKSDEITIITPDQIKHGKILNKSEADDLDRAMKTIREDQLGRFPRQVTTSGTQTRGGQSCVDRHTPLGVNATTYHESAHCLRFSGLWYSMYSLKKPRLHHKIRIEVLEKRGSELGGAKWVDVSRNIDKVIGTHLPHASSNNYPGISYDYMTIQSPDPYYCFSNFPCKLLVPKKPEETTRDYSPLYPCPAEEFLLLNSAEVTLDGESCNKVGVGFEAFYKQPHRCSTVAGTCLQNQPFHLYTRSKRAVRRGEQGEHFLGTYASLPDNPLIIANSTIEEDLLYLQYGGYYTCAAEIEVSGDHNPVMDKEECIAQISEVIIDATCTFHTRITIVVTNNGLLSHDFFTRIINCPNEVPRVWQDTESPIITIAPQHIHKYRLSLYGKLPMDSFFCSINVLDRNRKLAASRRIRVQMFDRCFCMWHCQCACVGGASGLQCIHMTLDQYKTAGFVGSLPPQPFANQWMTTGWMFECLAFSLEVLGVLLVLGLLKAIIGQLFMPYVWSWGLWIISPDSAKRVHTYYEHDFAMMCTIYDGEGYPLHPLTLDRSIRILPKSFEFFFNVFFFTLLPASMLLGVIGRCYTKIIKAYWSTIDITTQGKETFEEEARADKKDEKSDFSISMNVANIQELIANTIVTNLQNQYVIYRYFTEPVGGAFSYPGEVYSIQGFLARVGGRYYFRVLPPVRQYWTTDGKLLTPSILLNPLSFQLQYDSASAVIQDESLTIEPRGVVINSQEGAEEEVEDEDDYED